MYKIYHQYFEYITTKNTYFCVTFFEYCASYYYFLIIFANKLIDIACVCGESVLFLVRFQNNGFSA